MRETAISINEREFIENALVSGLRVDGRRVNDMRKLQVNFHDEHGSVEILLGRTRCVVVPFVLHL